MKAACSLLLCLAVLAGGDARKPRANRQTLGNGESTGMRGSRRSLTQTQALCNVSSTPRNPWGEPMWYAQVDGRPVYNGSVNASDGVTLYCASSANVTSQITCSPATQRWDARTPFSASCLDCQRQLNGTVLGSARVYSLRNGDSVTINGSQHGWSCPFIPPFFQFGYPPPPPIRPVPVYNRSEDQSWAVTIMADSLQDRWIMASTCGLREVIGDDTQLRVRAGCDANQTRIIENGDFCGIQSQLAFLAVAGQSYTVYLSSANRTCIKAPMLTLKAEAGSDPTLSKQSYLISPSTHPGQCISALAPGMPATLQPCDSNNLTQYIQIKDVGNGRVFLRPTHFEQNTTLTVDNSTGIPRLIGFAEPGASLANPYKEPPSTTTSSADGEPPVWVPPTEDEQFIIRALPNGLYQILHPHSGLCLASGQGNLPTFLTAALVLSRCDATALDQAFQLSKPAGLTPAALVGQYIRVNLAIANTMCWQTADSDGGPVALLFCNTTNKYQTFLVRDAGNGFVQLVEQGSGKQRVLELPPGAMDDDILLQINQTSTGALNQLWSLKQTGGYTTAFRAISALTALCIRGSTVAPFQLYHHVCADEGRDASTPDSETTVDFFQNFIFTSVNPPGPPAVVQAPPPLSLPSQTPAGDGAASSSVQTGAIVGIVVGSIAVVALACGVLGFWYLPRRKRMQQAASNKEFDPLEPKGMHSSSKDTSSAKDVAHADTAPVARQKLHVKGLVKGEPFLRGAAPHFTWNDLVPGPTCQAVEEGVNAEQLDKLAGAPAGAGSPVVQLSSADIAQQIELLKEGLLGRGATALVFKCRWPSRFGPNALLACKVLRDPFDGELSEHLLSFQYEAKVLEGLRHPNIVRLYGYCLEAPTVCLIMELLPVSLRKRPGYTDNSTIFPSSLGGVQNSPIPNSTGLNSLQVANSQPISAPTQPVGRQKSYLITSGSTETQGLPQPVSGDSNPTPSSVDMTINVGEATGLMSRSADGQEPKKMHTATSALALHAHPDGHIAEVQTTEAATSQPLPTVREAFELGPDACSSTWDTSQFVMGSSSSLGNPRALSPTTSGDVKHLPPYSAIVQIRGSQQRPGPLIVDVEAGPSGSHSPEQPGTGHVSPWAVLESAAEIGATDSSLFPASGTPSQVSHSNAPRRSPSMSHDPNAPRINPAQQASRFTMLEVLRMSTDIACGLAYLHQRPAPGLETSSSLSSHTGHSASTWDRHSMIVHRDLKPANVLVNSQGVAKICDFGLARAHDSTTIYSVHVAVGTLRYMAPELLDGESNRPITDRVDLYSLGMLMWEMVTGEPPWKGLTDPQIMTAVQLKKRPSMNINTQPAALLSRPSALLLRSSEDRAWMAANTLDEKQASVFANDLWQHPSRRSSLAGPSSLQSPSSSMFSPTTPSLVGWQASGPLPRADMEHSSAPARQSAASSVPNLGPRVSVSGVATNAAGERVWTSTQAQPKSTVSSPNLGAHLSAGAQGSPAGCLAADTVASFDAIPQFKTLVSACWQHNSIRRPTAQAVYKQLATLLRQYQQPQQTLQQPHVSGGRAGTSGQQVQPPFNEVQEV